MTAQQIITLCRYQLGDEQKPFKWSDAELVDYMNLSISEACRKAWLIRDVSTTACCRITLATSTADYALDATVLRVMRAKIANIDNDLERKSANYYNELYPCWRDETAGLPTEYCLDYKQGYITLRVPPSATYNGYYLWLDVYRLPTTELTTSTLSSSPEIRADYHKYLVHHMLEWAFSKPGQETFSQFKAQYHGAKWRMAIDEMRKSEIMRQWYDLDNLATPEQGRL